MCEFLKVDTIGRGGETYGFITGTNKFVQPDGKIKYQTYAAEVSVDIESFCVYNPAAPGSEVWNDYITYSEASLCMSQLKNHCILHG